MWYHSWSSAGGAKVINEVGRHRGHALDHKAAFTVDKDGRGLVIAWRIQSELRC